MRRILLPLLVIGLAAGLFTLGSGAFFSDSATDSGNTITAGTLSFSCTQSSAACSATNHWTVTGAVPGVVVSPDFQETLANNGSITGGDLWAKFVLTPLADTSTTCNATTLGNPPCDGNADIATSNIDVVNSSTGFTASLNGAFTTLAGLPTTCTLVASSFSSADFHLSSIKLDGPGATNAMQGDGMQIDAHWELVQSGQTGTCP